jgi:hypothetical protein
MGLAERRALKAFQDEHFPGLKKALDQAAGFEVALEVRWDTLATPEYAHLYAEAFPKVFFQPLAAALADIARDDMGKAALRAGLKKVVVCNTADKYGESAFTFEGGVLTLDHSPVTNLDDVELRRGALVKLLEGAL